MNNKEKQKFETILIISIFIALIISIIISIYYSLYVRDLSVYFYSRVIKYNIVVLIPILLFHRFFKDRRSITKLLFVVISLLIITANMTIAYQCKNIINSKNDYEINDVSLLKKASEKKNVKVSFYSNDCESCKKINNDIVLHLSLIHI